MSEALCPCAGKRSRSADHAGCRRSVDHRKRKRSGTWQLVSEAAWVSEQETRMTYIYLVYTRYNFIPGIRYRLYTYIYCILEVYNI